MFWFVQLLADKLRPIYRELLIDQKHLLNKNGILNRIFNQNKIPPRIFYASNKNSKTILTKILLKINNYFSEITSVMNTIIQKSKQIFQITRNKYKYFYKITIFFIYKVYFFKKNQQDILIQYIENIKIILIKHPTIIFINNIQNCVFLDNITFLKMTIKFIIFYIKMILNKGKKNLNINIY